MANKLQAQVRELSTSDLKDAIEDAVTDEKARNEVEAVTLEERVFEYMRTLGPEGATPRKIAKALGANRYRVKQVLHAMAERGILDHDQPLLVPAGLLPALFNGAKPPKMALPTDTARPADAPTAVQTEVRRI